MFTLPTLSDFKTYWFRDFPFQPASEAQDLSTVQDQDITNAIGDATMGPWNPGLWPDQASFTNAFLHLIAHYLAVNLQNSSQGIDGQYDWLHVSKAAGSVNESFGIPEEILANPTLAMLCKTSYGAKYLQFCLPKLVGGIFTACEMTKP